MGNSNGYKYAVVSLVIMFSFRGSSGQPVCGGKLYNFDIDICCDGNIIRGGALGRWGCCGQRPFSLSRELCCNGTVHDVYNVETSNKRCCGSYVLGNSDGVCCNNTIILGQNWCPGSEEEASHGKLWLPIVGLTSAVLLALIIRSVLRKTRSSINYKHVYIRLTF